ncbi:GNAT family N-acetyltransferase [Bradyrhizobium sp. BRP22]|uniref:GNAT family N-acetyltransferase n=1 Tax=Bradyrhizobium sp. BRP22 TaxID=2793821 RepID=UPI001CD5E7E5|nr:GNAT family N-acetyltransferase [Bradyrhizobium sp. BRP22]MCA1452336.1 GNAT family N-acetyltransferase [Bradyrhizobium sp. BRP22]
MNENFRITRATQDDAVQVARIHIAATRAAYRDIYTLEYLDGLSTEDRAYRWIEKDRGHLALGDPFSVFVAFDNDMMIGFADVGPTTKSGVAELYAIYLDPEYIAKGAGKVLLEACIDYAGRNGFKAMIATVLTKNSLARAFYERRGARALTETETLIETGGTKEKVISYLWDNLQQAD